MENKTIKATKQEFGHKLAFIIAVWRRLKRWSEANDIDLTQVRAVWLEHRADRAQEHSQGENDGR